MEQKTKTIISIDNMISDVLLLSDEQVRLLNYLYNSDYFSDCVSYVTLPKEIKFKEL